MCPLKQVGSPWHVEVKLLEKEVANMKGAWLLVLCAFVFSGASIAGAALIGPEWPAPGGTTYTTSGGAGSAGGLTISYSGFDPSQYAELYWGPWEGAPIGASLNGSTIEASEYMTLSTFSGNTATWTGSSTWSYFSGGQWHNNQAIDTRLTVTLSPSMSFVDADPLGPSVGVLAQVTGDYTANLLFEACFFGTWRPVNVGYNMYQTPPGVQTGLDFSGGYYHTPVPIPDAALLFGSGLLGLLGIRRRK